LYEGHSKSIQATGTTTNAKGKYARENFASYFTSPQGNYSMEVWFGNLKYLATLLNSVHYH
jgi:hypothetical protein